MPLSVILGHGNAELTELCGYSPKLDPRYFAHIGARDLDLGERQQIERFCAGGCNRAGNQRGFGPHIGIDETQPVNVFLNGTCADPTSVGFADPMRRQWRAAQDRELRIAFCQARRNCQGPIARVIVNCDDAQARLRMVFERKYMFLGVELYRRWPC